jgi:hypothetical protein
MGNGQAVLVITEPLGSGEPQYTLYYVAEGHYEAAERIIAAIAAPNETVRVLAPIPEAVIKVLGLKPREFRQA